MRKRADSIFDLVDALSVAGHVDSPVALSEEAPFRRKFSSIFDTLLHSEFDFDLLLQTLLSYQPDDSDQLADYYEVYALDCTPNDRPEAVTLEGRGSLKTLKNEPVRYGHKYSWLARLVYQGTSWAAPVDVRRVDTSLSVSQVAGVQVKELDQRDSKPKVVVAESLYGNHVFQVFFLLLKFVYALVRLRSNLVSMNGRNPG